ncbi:hypothetical protein JD969_09500 [Planctomycetota bacterium]|nr:hypothetical protein JD969_09500 [Planctomycetota bacterium]
MPQQDQQPQTDTDQFLCQLTRAIYYKLHFISILVLGLFLIAIAWVLKYEQILDFETGLTFSSFILLAYIIWPPKPFSRK